MNVNMQSMINSLTEITRAIGKDGELQLWFWKLGKKSLEARRNAVYVMSARIAAMGKPGADLAMAFKLLAIPLVFEAVSATLHEGGCAEV